MSETWKGKTRGGTFGYMFFIYMIRCLGITAAYGFLSLVVLYFIPFAPKATASTWQYARNRLKYGRAKAAGLLLKNYYRLGQILIDKVAIGNGMADKYHFEFENYQAFLNVLNGNTGVIMIGAHVGNWEIGAPFFDEYGKKINIVMFDAEHERIKEILEKNIFQTNSGAVFEFERGATVCLFFSGSVLLRYGYLPHILQWLQWLPQCRGRCPLGS